MVNKNCLLVNGLPTNYSLSVLNQSDFLSGNFGLKLLKFKNITEITLYIFVATNNEFQNNEYEIIIQFDKF